MITHIVFFKLKDRSSESVNKVVNMLAALDGKIPQIKHIEVGIDILHSERSYDFALLTKFDSLDDLQAYQIHPAHVEVADYIAKVKESSISVDYEC